MAGSARAGARILLLSLLLGRTLLGAAADAAAREPVPDAAAQAKALKSIRDLFKSEYAKKSVGDRAALAGKMLTAAGESGSDSVSAYVLLRESRDLGVSIGLPDVALAASAQLGTQFDVDAGAQLSETLTALSHQATSAEAAAAVVNATLTEIAKAVSIDDFDAVARLSPVAQSAAGKTRSGAFSGRVEALLKELKDRHSAFDKFKAAQLTLETQPDDVEANTLVGKYLWLQKKNWASAAPYLAKSQDGPLKSLAAADIAQAGKTVDPKADAERAEAWIKYAGTQTGDVKLAAHRRGATLLSQASAASSGLQKLKVDKRLQQVNAEVAVHASRGFEADPVIAEARRESIEKMQTARMSDKPLSGDVILPVSAIPWTIKGSVKAAGAANISARSGTEVRGGQIELGGGGHLSVVGTASKPVIFRHVTIVQDMGGSFGAENAVFDDCRFVKGGAWFYNAGYTSKWTFNACVLYRCQFANLNEIDFGFQLINSALVSMDFPEIAHPHNPGFSHISALHHDWNKITGCVFVDCNVPPTVCWCAETSNFFGCKFVPGEAFESSTAWTDKAYFLNTIGTPPLTVWSVNPPKHAAVALESPPAPFPIPPVTGIAPAIPELFLTDDDAGVTRSHFDKKSEKPGQPKR